MKTTLLAATLALIVGAPLVASAADVAQSRFRAAAYQERAGATQRPSSSTPSVVEPQFIGPFELHNGLLPNGLRPNPFTYG